MVICWYKKKTRSHVVGIPVISVGNLASGGTGKSVVVQLLAQMLQPYHVAIISRGYGRQSSDTCIVSDGERCLVSVEQAGDEVYMLAQQTQATVVVGNSRFLAVQALKKYNQDANKTTNVLLLDDGYQNFDLVKNLEIVLIDASSPFGNNHCLPAGPLRERSLARAQCVLITRADAVSREHLKNVYALIVRQAPHVLVCATAHAVTAVIDGVTRQKKPIEQLQQRVLVVSGIARNEAFESTVVSLGCIVVQVYALPDHHAYTVYDSIAIQNILRNHAISTIITTAKDWYKIKTLVFPDGVRCIVVHIGIEFLYDDEQSAFRALIEQVVHPQ